MKRPIVWFGTAYIFGEVFGLVSHPAAALGAAAVVMVIICMCTGKTAGRHPLTRVCFMVLPFFMAAGALRAAGAAAETEDALQAFEMFGQNIQVSGKAVRIEEKSKVNYIYITVTESTEEALCGRKLILASDKETVVDYGDLVTANGKTVLFEPASNPGVYDAREAFAVLGVYYQLFPEKMTVTPADGHMVGKLLLRFKNKLKSVYSAMLSEKDAGIVCGMVLGEKQTMDTQLKELYQRQGIAHIFAISGVQTLFLA